MLRNDSGQPLTVFSMANRTGFAAQGLAGGHADALREYRLNGVAVDPKGRLELAPGDRLTMPEAGGGGIGDPANRPSAQVACDVRAGFVSPSEAARLYRYPLPSAYLQGNGKTLV